MRLTDRLISVMKEHAVAEYPNEACGIVTDRNRYVRIKNIHPDPGNFFEMPENTWLKHKVAAVFHSHPDREASPSAADMAAQMATDVPWILCSAAKGGETRDLFVWGDGNIPPLIGREFRHGPSGSDGRGDCYAIVRDWYKLNKNIELPEFPRDDEWWKNGADMYAENFAVAGFRPFVSGETPDVGDIALMTINSDKENHAAVYIGNELILHHLALKLSRREPCGRWRKLIRRWLRYA